MSQRGIRMAWIELVVEFGRHFVRGGADVYVVGRKEVELQRSRGLDLSAVEGVHVVLREDDCLMTTYRNRERLSLRTRKRRHNGRVNRTCQR